MFGDLGEQEYVFSLLDEWASIQKDMDLIYDTGIKSTLNKELTKLIDAVYESEAKTIAKNPKLNLGFSFQSKLLSELLYLLIGANTPAKLLANLPKIKTMLLQAMVIGLDIKYDKLNFIFSEVQPDAEMGKNRKKQMKNWSESGVDAVIKYHDSDKEDWLNIAKKLRDENSKISLRSMAQIIQKRSPKKPNFETIRKYLGKEMGKAL